MEMGIPHCMAMTTRYVRNTIGNFTDKQFEEIWYGKTKTEILEYCKQLDKAGYIAIPSCKNCNEKGICQGHPEEKIE